MAKARRNPAFIRGAHPRVPGCDGERTIAYLMGPTALPLLRGVGPVRTVELGHPDRRRMHAQAVVDHALAPTRSPHMEADRGVLPSPCPLLLAVAARPGCLAAEHATAAQAGEAFGHAMLPAACDHLDPVGQAPFTEAPATPLRPARRASLIAHRRGGPPGRRQTLAGGPQRRAGFHPRRDRGHIGLPTAGTAIAIRLPARDDRPDGRHRDLVIHRLQRGVCLGAPGPPLGTDLRLGAEPWVRIGVPESATAGPTDPGVAPPLLRWAYRGVGRACLRGWHAGRPRLRAWRAPVGVHFG